jgi:hypothetical protein
MLSPPPTLRPAPTQEIFYRISPANEGLVFSTPIDAFRNHTMRTAIESSKTWGEFRRALGEGDYHDVLREMSEAIAEPVEVPDDDDPFVSSRIPGDDDGDYPQWLQQKMDELIPADILAKFGEPVATMLNGDYVHIDPSFERRIIYALRKRGYKVHRREDLFFT